MKNLTLPTTPESLLPIVLEAMSNTPDPRLRQLIGSLTTHLHQFIIENRVSEEEFQKAASFLVNMGQQTGEKKNEVILVADLLGISAVVSLVNNPLPDGTSEATLLGPFWRANAPQCAAGDCIARANGSKGQSQPMEVRGRVFDAHQRPLTGAVVDVWQADPKGFYENQDPDQPNMNLRGRFATNDQGEYFIKTVMPAGYPVPTDGPGGELLRVQKRQPYRPAHLHFMVSHPGFKVLVTQVFPNNAEHLDNDPGFAVMKPLLADFKEEQRDGKTTMVLTQDFHLSPGETRFPAAPIP